jgi:asparagine synthase (glutamine-hydrolysing)
MCGIAGIFDGKGARPIDRAAIARMSQALLHRGPDGDGLHVASGIALAHRRLSIIDLAGGKQPLFNEDGTVVITYNGEIYNFQALAAELTRAGHRFRTHSDTEVVVHGWEEWGEA